MLGRRFAEAAEHLEAEGNDLDSGGEGGWEGRAVVVALILVPPLRCSAICAGRSMHIGVGAGVDERNVKDHSFVMVLLCHSSECG